MQVCCQFFSKVYGISKDKAMACMRQARGIIRDLPDRKVVEYRPSKKSDRAYAFWHIFFEQHCQRPNNETRLFPVNKAYHLIYKEYFEPWFKTINAPISEKPCLSIFRKVRLHPDFADVKKRPKHKHCICSTCDALRTRLLQGFQDHKVLEDYKAERRRHDASVLAWRELLAQKIAEAKYNSANVLCFEHDGTEAMGFPRVGRRDTKNLTKSRFNVVPFHIQEHATQRSDYVYLAKGRYKKDCNYIITLLYAAIKRVKENYAHPSFRARKCVFIADNASENKNNELLAFCTELVAKGWFDDIELLFGEVGHTHNGIDANHKIHNNGVADHWAGDLGHFVANYRYGWVNESRRPQASVLDVVFDWKGRYSNKIVDKLSGFTKTSYDPLIVRGWRIFKNNNGVPEVKWKLDPGLDKEWRGADGTFASAGWNIFKELPRGRLQPVDPQTDIMSETHREHIRAESMRNLAACRETPNCISWCYDASKDGVIPVALCLEDSRPQGEWGQLCSVGTHVKGQIRYTQIIFVKSV